MPLIHIIQENNFKLGVWKITENESFFYHKLSFCPLVKKSALKKLQFMAARLILKELDNQFDINNIIYKHNGKPFYLNNSYHFNISHSSTFAVAILSKNSSVGIDIELISNRVLRVTNHFLNANELILLNNISEDMKINIISLFWTVKETVLKWIGDSLFNYIHDITILTHELSDSGIINVKIDNYAISNVEVHYFKIHNYWVSYLSLT